MPEIDLKAYTTRAMQLETAIYTQKKLMSEHENLIQAQRPTAPQLPNLQEPVKPIKPRADGNNFSNGVLWIVGGLVLLGCFGFMAASPVLGIFMLIACAYGFGNILSQQSKISEDTQNAIQQYEQDMKDYGRKLEEYQQSCQITNNNYTNQIQDYNVRVAEYDKKSSVIGQKHIDVLTALEATLQELYDQNIIYPKYRNMVAITAINEYLMSGRCFELEGPNGSYNLYEMELRQSIIIDKLSSIIDNLEQIRSNQYSLYQELQMANLTVKGILQEVRGVNDNVKLAAYFAGVTALIEASPKIYIGHTF